MPAAKYTQTLLLGDKIDLKMDVIGKRKANNRFFYKQASKKNLTFNNYRTVDYNCTYLPYYYFLQLISAIVFAIHREYPGFVKAWAIKMGQWPLSL